MTTIETKLTKLENKLRFFQFAFILIILIAIFFIVTGFNRNPVADIIQAKKIQVVDDYGNVLVSLMTSDMGNGTILTLTKKGKTTTRLVSTLTGNGMLEVYNSDEEIVSKLGTTDRKTGYLSLKNSNGNDLFTVTYTSGNYGGWLGLYNNAGINTFQTSTGDDGSCRLNMYNGNNTRICYLGTTAAGDGCLNVYNSVGQNLNGVWAK